MSVQKWDAETLVVHLSDDPVLSDIMAEVNARLDDRPRDVVLDFSDVGVLTSSGISALLRLRKRQIEAGRWLVLCSPRDTVWSVFLTTGIDTLFEFAEDISQALTRIKSERG
jgi:anti-anti-sigma factor